MIDIKSFKCEEDLKSRIRDEGNYESFESCGYKCRLIRMSSGHWCGYLGVPKECWAFGKDNNYYLYDEKDTEKYTDSYLSTVRKVNSLEVHGGLTYSRNYVYLQPEKELRRFGFDTAHGGDLSPRRGGTGEYRDINYCREQLMKLAKQVKGLQD